jgi:anti-sigma factor RsiW
MSAHPSGWTCERTVLRLEYYLLDTIPREEAQAVAEHLEACPGCAQRLVLYRVTIRQAGPRA